MSFPPTCDPLEDPLKPAPCQALCCLLFIPPKTREFVLENNQLVFFEDVEIIGAKELAR